MHGWKAERISIFSILISVDRIFGENSTTLKIFNEFDRPTVISKFQEGINGILYFSKKNGNLFLDKLRKSPPFCLFLSLIKIEI